MHHCHHHHSQWLLVILITVFIIISIMVMRMQQRPGPKLHVHQYHGALGLTFQISQFPVKWVKTSTHKCKSCKTKLVEHVSGTQNASSPVKARTWEGEWGKRLILSFRARFPGHDSPHSAERMALQMDFKAPTLGRRLGIAVELMQD